MCEQNINDGGDVVGFLNLPPTYLAFFKKDPDYNSFDKPALSKFGLSELSRAAGNGRNWFIKFMIKSNLRAQLEAIIWYFWGFCNTHSNEIEYAHLRFAQNWKAGDSIQFCVYTTSQSDWFLKSLINIELKLMTLKNIKLRVDVVSFIVTNGN